jgi:alpha-tubulin suppressor-like RCC1 family protein
MFRRMLVAALAAFTLSCSDPTGPRENEILSVVSGNGFSCALVGERVYCWGRNDNGQLGRGTVGDSAGPGLVSGTNRYKLIAASERTACGVTTVNAVLCWGNGRIHGTASSMPFPTAISGTFPTSIASIGVGWGHGCVRSSAGAAMCFGTNALGEIGNGTQLPATGTVGATAVVGGHVFTQLSVGAFHTCGIEGGAAWCWGTNYSSSFGPGTSSGAPYPTPMGLTLPFSAVRIEAGSAVTCANDATGKTWCWGTNVAGQLGRGPGSPSLFSETPMLMTQTTAFTSIGLSRLNSTVSHSCGIVTDGSVYCWGASDGSQLGRASTETCFAGTVIACGPTPGRPQSALAYTQIAPGRDHTCGLTTDNEIYCWGSDRRRQLGGTVGDLTMAGVRVIIPK